MLAQLISILVAGRTTLWYTTFVVAGWATLLLATVYAGRITITVIEVFFILCGVVLVWRELLCVTLRDVVGNAAIIELGFGIFIVAIWSFDCGAWKRSPETAHLVAALSLLTRLSFRLATNLSASRLDLRDKTSQIALRAEIIKAMARTGIAAELDKLKKELAALETPVAQAKGLKSFKTALEGDDGEMDEGKMDDRVARLLAGRYECVNPRG